MRINKDKPTVEESKLETHTGCNMKIVMIFSDMAKTFAGRVVFFII